MSSRWPLPFMFSNLNIVYILIFIERCIHVSCLTTTLIPSGRPIFRKCYIWYLPDIILKHSDFRNHKQVLVQLFDCSILRVNAVERCLGHRGVIQIAFEARKIQSHWFYFPLPLYIVNGIALLQFSCGNAMELRFCPAGKPLNIEPGTLNATSMS
jgi:hypothetical protein